LLLNSVCQKGTALVEAMVWNPKPMRPEAEPCRRFALVWSTETTWGVNEGVCVCQRTNQANVRNVCWSTVKPPRETVSATREPETWPPPYRMPTGAEPEDDLDVEDFELSNNGAVMPHVTQPVDASHKSDDPVSRITLNGSGLQQNGGGGVRYCRENASNLRSPNLDGP
jgi:hypothetical protein